MTLPQALAKEIEVVTGSAIASATPVGGGCVSTTTRVRCADGQQLFLKWSPPHEHRSNFFAEEARSLGALAATGSIRVPAVVHASASWLLLEWLEPGNPTHESWRSLGTALANLHEHHGEHFGWVTNNFIGSLPQSNGAHHDWPEFWRSQRILPQLERAGDGFTARDRTRFDALLAELPALLPDANAEGASLLHGDLWSGNIHMLADGSPALVDPSCYYGHREVDIAMARLFGGFPDEFYAAYDDAWPLQPNAEQRMRVYQLYYLLVHVNLFGGSYVGSTMSLVGKLGF